MKLTYQHMKTKTITSRSFAKRAIVVLAVLFTALTAGATQFITDVMVIGGSKEVVEELKTTYKAQSTLKSILVYTAKTCLWL